MLGHDLQLLGWKTLIMEDPHYQNDRQMVFLLNESVPDKIRIAAGDIEKTFTWVTIVGRSEEEVLKEAHHIFASMGNLFESHVHEWKHFWDQSDVCVVGFDELSKVIHASLYALASSLPSLNTSQSRHAFYSLSPSGLGIGGSSLKDGYRGHSFWDTEMWMQPPILLLEPRWSRELLKYRSIMSETAEDNAAKTGYKGLR